MIENEISKHYKIQSEKARYYLKRYIEELKLHFLIEDKHIIRILNAEIKDLKKQNSREWWFNIFKIR